MELRRIGRLAIFQVLRDGQSIGTINAHDPARIHAADGNGRHHYADTIEACEAWLVRRADGAS